MKVYCLFEQSGTFKNEFKKLGVDAYDFDIQNEFNETDYIVDLFAEIRGGTTGSRQSLTTWTKKTLFLRSFLVHGLKIKYNCIFAELLRRFQTGRTRKKSNTRESYTRNFPKTTI